MDSNKAKAKFKFKVNNSIYTTNIECLTGTKILNIAGFEDPNCYDLILVRRGKDELIKPDQTVCLSDPGVERFRVRPKRVNDGFKEGESPLPLKDMNYLENYFKDNWEIKKLSNLNVLLIHDFELPQGYNVHKSNMIIIIPDRYDSVQLDMAYFKPHLFRVNDKPIVKVTNRNFGEESYQQWSRHRGNENPWIIGVDCIETHIELIKFFLRKELER